MKGQCWSYVNCAQDNMCLESTASDQSPCKWSLNPHWTILSFPFPSSKIDKERAGVWQLQNKGVELPNRFRF